MLVRNNDNRLTKEQLEGRLQNEPKPKSARLITPNWISKEAQTEWRRLVKQFKAMDAQLITDLDVNALAIYCDAVVTYRKAMQKVRETSEVMTAKNNPGKPIKNPWLMVANDAATQIKKYGEVLCLDPVSRARVGIGRSKKEVDPNADLFD